MIGLREQIPTVYRRLTNCEGISFYELVKHVLDAGFRMFTYLPRLRKERDRIAFHMGPVFLTLGKPKAAQHGM